MEVSASRSRVFRGSLPTPSSTAPLLEAAADAVRERGWMQGAALGDEQAGRCNRRTGWGSSCPPRQEVLDRLSLLLCSRELLGHVTGCVGEEASLGYRNLEEPNFVYVLMSTRHSQRWRSWTTSVDIARPRDRAIPFVARGARSGAVRSSFRTSGSWPPRACPSVLLAWRTCSNAVALGGGSISLAGWNQTSTYRPGRGGTVCPAGWRQYKDTLTSQLTAPPGTPPVTPSCTTEGGEGGGVSRLVSGSKRCRPRPVSSSCTSGREAPGAGRWEPAQATPRNQSSNLEG